MKYVFLSRPRRFGKSLFASTLHAYYEGRKEFFEGLAIFYLIFSLMGAYVRVEEDSAIGHADVVIYMPDAVFVFELKLDGSAEAASVRLTRKAILCLTLPTAANCIR